MQYFDRKLESDHISFQSIQVQRGMMKENQVIFGQRLYGSKKIVPLSAAGKGKTNVETAGIISSN